MKGDLKRWQKEERVPESIITEARKLHCNAIEKLIEDLKKVIYTLDIHRIDDFNSEAIYSIEDNPLFVCLKEHLPFPKIWDDYDSWRSENFHYKGNCHSLFKRIKKEKAKDFFIRMPIN